jgi:protein TonB
MSRGGADQPASPLDQTPAAAPHGRWLGVAGAALAHVGLFYGALHLSGLSTHLDQLAKLSSTQMFEVELEPEPPPPPPPAEPEPPRPAPRPRAAEPPPAPEAAPAAAQAAEVLAQEPKEEVVDFGDTFVQGKADQYAGGFTESTGTSQNAVRDARAAAGGVPGGQGTDTSGIDRSRAPALAGGADWDCPFPEEADDEGIDDSAVTLRVEVLEDGRVKSVVVEQEAHRGFGREARRCAMRKRWQPGLDRAGRAAAMTTRVKVVFTR